MTKSESSSVAKTRFYAEGNQLPKCCHIGCNNDVAVREWKYWSFKGECGRCINARKKGIEVEGVTNIKKKYCENIAKVVNVTPETIIPIFVSEKSTVNILEDVTKDGIHIVIGIHIYNYI